MNIKVGDTVRVVAAKNTFSDYQNGDLARVVEFVPWPGYKVEWIKRTSKTSAAGACVFLFSDEVVLHEAAQVVGLAEWAAHYAIGPAALEALNQLLGHNHDR